MKNWVLYDQYEKFNVNNECIPIILGERLTKEEICDISSYYSVNVSIGTSYINNQNEDNLYFKGKREDDSICIIKRGSKVKKLAEVYALHKNIPLQEVAVISEIAGINKKYIHYISLNPTYEEIASVQNYCSDKKIGFIMANYLEELSLLIAKICSPNNRSNDFSSYFFPIIDDTIQPKNEGDLKIITRKEEPFERLINSDMYSSIIATHGSGEQLYFGNSKISATSNNNAEYSASKIKANHLFIDTCFGLRFEQPKGHPVSKPLWESLIKGNSSSIFLYPGVKENSSIECIWYYCLTKLGFDLGTCLRTINDNLWRAGELGNYVLIGSPEEKLFQKSTLNNCTPPIVVENITYKNKIIFNIDKDVTSDVILVKIHDKNVDLKEYILSSNIEVNWFIFEENLILYSPRNNLTGQYMLEKNTISLNEYTPNSFELLESLNVINASSQGQIKELKSTYTAATKQISYALYNTKSYNSLKKHMARLYNLKKTILIATLEKLSKTASEGIFPFTETYSSYFGINKPLETTQKSNTLCYYCNSSVRFKELNHNINKELERLIVYCPTCGIIEDKPNENSFLKVDSIIIDEDSIRVKISSELEKENQECFISITCQGNNLSKVYEVKTSQKGKISLETILEKKNVKREFNVIKVFMITEDKLWYAMKPMYL